MNSFDFSVTSKNGELRLLWPMSGDMLRLGMQQAGMKREGSDHAEKFKAAFVQRNKFCWLRYENVGLFDNLPKQPKILDVGCGVGALDMLIAKRLPDSKIWMLDKDEETIYDRNSGIFWGDEYRFFYNRWSLVDDVIKLNGLDKSRFTFLGPNDEWPEDLSIINSSISWCYHYPLSFYKDKLVASLRVGGKLRLDVRNIEGDQMLAEIEELMGCKTQILIEYSASLREPEDNTSTEVINGSYARSCIWTRRRP